MNKLAVSIVTIILSSSPFVYAANESNTSFNKAKKMLERDVYPTHRQTLYCDAAFDEKKFVVPPEGFKTDKYVKRAKKIEWEHVVPAENFGRTFKEWRDGDALCVDSKGKSFKGRKCAEKVNTEYRYMQADMFNLYPAIGAVNALRKNYNFTMLPGEESDFGSCSMKVDSKKAEPPVVARGRIARTYLYMEEAYSNYNMSKQQRQLMNAWDKMYPVNAWECERAKKISVLQKSSNLVVQSRCEVKSLWK
ncbi:endonuclease [Psychromonas sp. 14N.309.X.WAT.B.A12]|uniref:endonuclease n=1 Tax=Psychromonas sp. 14N.309.X.WAT.B.A12 TaxID=2998322 RepID=UPI0025AF6967|nr:endonuclease [Psychromonas sp. 14N.309.X.WAT.B.A12]MDN2662637.1 endonuclease [Psychromonas sp. 14N.309.X.WAT.B.A12]